MAYGAAVCVANVARGVPILVRFGEFAKDRGATTYGDLSVHVEPFVQLWLTERAKHRPSWSRFAGPVMV